MRSGNRIRSACFLGGSAVMLVLACSVGQGQGQAHGSVLVRDCSVDIPAYDLAPNFFVADFIEEPETLIGLRRRAVTLRVQRGSYAEDTSDGLAIFVRSVDEIQNALIGVPIPLGPAEERPLVTMTLYLGASCPSGRPNSDYFIVPATLGAVAGTITFDAVYAPNIAGSGLEFAAHFDGVRFESVDTPEDRHAELDGQFSFFYQRGRPAQRFP
jgi:hypothetical protein